ncbi:MAG TPA: choice-of-anchor A family protein [Bryobacteraceae bacterium]|jgi:choice-of-anchor A domain-containing protein|nr:choice-of-anchor A family protein [Bryobacteraceae bacterium]
MKYIHWFLGATLLLGAIPSYANTAWSLGAAEGYNVFVFGSYSTWGWSSIDGSTAVGGSFSSMGSMGLDQTPGAADPAISGLVVGGSLALAGGQVNGDAWIGGATSSTLYGTLTVTGDFHYGSAPSGHVNVYGTETALHGSPLPIDFVTAATSLTQLSNDLTNVAANGAVTGNSSNYTLTATGCTLCVFNLTGGSMHSITIDAPEGATVLVNVSGSSSSFSNGSISYTGGATAANTIFNFGATTALSTSGIGFNGSILAPLATFTGANGQINGELIAKAVSGQSAAFKSGNIFSGDLNSGIGATTGASPAPTPEPATWLSLLTAVAAFVGFQKRRSGKRN